MTRLDTLLTASRIAQEAARAEIAAAFAMWEAVANIGFREAADPAQADILIGAQVEPEGWAFANVFYDTASSEPVKPISRALICLNPEKRWKIGFNGDLRTYDVRYTIAHEIGHTIGLDHPERSWPDHGLSLRGDLPRAAAGRRLGRDPALRPTRSRIPSPRHPGSRARCGVPRRSGSTPSAGEPEPLLHVLSELRLSSSRRISWDAAHSSGWSGFPFPSS